MTEFVLMRAALFSTGPPDGTDCPLLQRNNCQEGKNNGRKEGGRAGACMKMIGVLTSWEC